MVVAGEGDRGRTRGWSLLMEEIGADPEDDRCGWRRSRQIPRLVVADGEIGANPEGGHCGWRRSK